MQKFNFSYDTEEDDLFLFNQNSKSKGSAVIGNVVLDYDCKKQIVGMQLMNASEIITEITNGELLNIKQILEKLTDAKLDIKLKNKMLIIKIYLIGNKEELAPLISIPLIRENDAELAYS